MNTSPNNISRNRTFYEGSGGIFETPKTMFNYLKMLSYDKVQKKFFWFVRNPSIQMVRSYNFDSMVA